MGNVQERMKVNCCPVCGEDENYLGGIQTGTDVGQLESVDCNNCGERTYIEVEI